MRLRQRFRELGTKGFGSRRIQDKHQIGWKEGIMTALKIARNVVGTAGLLLAGYVFLLSLNDSARCIRNSTM